MSIFENKTKPELEAGNFIAYTDEPNTVVSGSGGGGGIAVFNIDVDSNNTYIPTFTYSEVKEAVISGKIPYTKAVYLDQKGLTFYVIAPVVELADNNSDSFSVTDYNNKYVATDPNKLMTQGE